jgi:hypothetical protein
VISKDEVYGIDPILGANDIESTFAFNEKSKMICPQKIRGGSAHGNMKIAEDDVMSTAVFGD